MFNTAEDKKNLDPENQIYKDKVTNKLFFFIILGLTAF